MLCALLITLHLGGSIPQAEAVASWTAASGCAVRIEGTCASACTMLLASGCVTPSARLGFHAPTWAGRAMAEPDRSRWAARMADHLPPRLARWYLGGPAHGARAVWITGTDAIRLGARPC